ncbi:MAG: putative DNA-directed DNA polymerase [Prokaryotic dsDNA virus sp.]|nr:MAG: putative DNA-directed DNA polymerase [Prokaryotic dsDNA virus sp.]QDP53159.1 MAG: putative DNA-directed DNA polymerase [Prokaryotic dsDNA virus sp.]|tara:strand:- start:23755 stop:24420 length:666 start_codon:yes stop_codon:yes gene_type:complete
MTDTNYTYLDIETIPSQSPAVLDKLRAEVKAPAQYKKPESIKEWIAENADRIAREQLAKTSFDPAHGHICTIAWAKDDGEIVSAHAGTVEDEEIVLRAFFFDLDEYHATTFVGHYVGGFDLRFILCRAVVLGVKIPRCIPRDPKPWSDRIFDTMTAWAGQKERISMDNLCAALGIEGKGDFDGSMVAEAWANGEHEKIAEYCRDDVHRTREIHRRFLAVGF